MVVQSSGGQSGVQIVESIPIEVEQLPVAALKPYELNARTHSAGNVRKLAKSLKASSYFSPILIDENNVIVAGHGRWLAAQLLGMTHVPVIRKGDLSEAQKRALRLADNKIQGVWNPVLLAEELNFLIAEDFDLSLTGFDTIEVDKLCTPSIDGEELDEPLPEPPASPVTRPGDEWALGRHKIICGNSLERSVYDRLLWGKKADAAFVDVPFNVPIAGHVSGNGRVQHDEFQFASGEMSRSEFRAFLITSLTHLRDNSRDGALLYICSDWRMIAILITAGEELGLKLLNIIVWVKPNPALGSMYRSQYELVAVFKHGTARHTNNIMLGRMGRNRSNVWQHDGASGFSKSREQILKFHPTTKPLQLVIDAIRDATQPGDLIIDSFGGSGTTLLAAELSGRRASLIEIEPKYVDVTLRRFQARTGVEPLLVPGMTPFSIVKQQRAAMEGADS